MLTWSTNAFYFQLGSEDGVDETNVLGQSHLRLLALHMDKSLLSLSWTFYQLSWGIYQMSHKVGIKDH